MVLNCGSSSIKYQVLDMGDTPQLLCKGLAERIGASDSVLKHESVRDGRKVEIQESFPTHTEGVERILQCIVAGDGGVLESLDELVAVGHRVVHGGEFFRDATLITPESKAKIEACNDLAPLHNPANLMGVSAMEALLPKVPQVAVFDTAFHQTLPERAYLYALPNEYYTKYRIRKYGFHGTSHRYVAERAAKVLGRPLEELKLITCHLGNGASMAAVRGGESVETSMGFTPVDGLMMGTRSGELDPSTLLFIAEREGLDLQGMNDLINKQSGLLGVSGRSNDMRDCSEAAIHGDRWPRAAVELFTYRICKFIGQYIAVLQGLDGLVFTGGIGENSSMVREMVVENFGYLGIRLDRVANDGNHSVEGAISAADSSIPVLVVPTNEELVIAQDTVRVASSL